MTTLKNAEPTVTLFDFKGQQLRLAEIDGTPWFLAVDVCRALGLDLNSGTSSALRKLDSDEKRIVPRHLMKGKGMSQAHLITESGLYKVVLRSDKPDAKEFQNWVTQVVLPSIRKDGGYVMGEEKLATGEMTEDELVLTAMRMMEDKVARYPATICQ